jgi:hypothetical protein
MSDIHVAARLDQLRRQKNKQIKDRDARITKLEDVLTEICSIYWSLPVPGPRDWDPLFSRARDLLEEKG